MEWLFDKARWKIQTLDRATYDGTFEALAGGVRVGVEDWNNRLWGSFSSAFADSERLPTILLPTPRLPGDFHSSGGTWPLQMISMKCDTFSKSGWYNSTDIEEAINLCMVFCSSFLVPNSKWKLENTLEVRTQKKPKSTLTFAVKVHAFFPSEIFHIFVHNSV